MRILQFCFIIILSFHFSCESNQKQQTKYTLKLKGSESMHSTFDALKYEFESQQDSVVIEIEGGGSLTGLLAMKEKTADIGLSSFPYRLDSILGVNHGITERIVAYDGIILISNRNNPVSQLSNEQIGGIYSGIYTDWSQLGGNDGQILPIIRDSNSGTQKFFQSYFKVDQLNPMAQVADENKSIVSLVKTNKHGIGFIGFGYFTESVNRLNIPSGVGLDTAFTQPTLSNLRNGIYPLKRSLQIYYHDPENPGIEAFLTFLNTKESFLVFREQGLMPTTDRLLVMSDD